MRCHQFLAMCRAKRPGRKARYESAPRRTAADESGDVRSLERALDQRLFMVVCEAGAPGAQAQG